MSSKIQASAPHQHVMAWQPTQNGREIFCCFLRILVGILWAYSPRHHSVCALFSWYQTHRPVCGFLPCPTHWYWLFKMAEPSTVSCTTYTQRARHIPSNKQESSEPLCRQRTVACNEPSGVTKKRIRIRTDKDVLRV